MKINIDGKISGTTGYYFEILGLKEGRLNMLVGKDDLIDCGYSCSEIDNAKSIVIEVNGYKIEVTKTPY